MKRPRALIISLALAAVLAAVSAAPAEAAVRGTLIKIACAGTANDACTAVYYYGHDGKRHAFPNEKVYFTWFADFSAVRTVSGSEMASIPLGQNITYRPGVKLVKFLSVNDVYAVALGGELRWVQTEDTARSLYGLDWNAKVDDISDAFFTDYRLGEPVASVTDYDKSAELAAAPDVDSNLDSSALDLSVGTSRGNFSVELVRLQRKRFEMITDVAETEDCDDACAVRPLSEYVSMNRGTIGIHGSYFCPPDYADCAGKVNTFLSPFYDAPEKTMRNQNSLAVHDGPMIGQLANGEAFYLHRTKEFGESVSGFEATQGSELTGAASNYPSLVENGAVIVENEARLDDAQRTVKATRGAIGYDEHFFYLAVARSATVVDLAYVMQTLGADWAMNLDGGGSAALWYDGSYLFGPGRLLPNAIIFRAR